MTEEVSAERGSGPHIKARVLERYGQSPTDDDITQWREMIIRGEADFVTKQPRKAELWVVWWDRYGLHIPVICCRKRKWIITALDMRTPTLRKWRAAHTAQSGELISLMMLQAASNG